MKWKSLKKNVNQIENENKNETEIASILQMFIIPFRLHVFK